MSFEDSNSFLFGLNHFTSPNANGASSSTNENHHSAELNDRDGSSASILDSLGAFGAPVGNSAHGNDILEGGSFAEQLALWTNANFSFDGPTGHALLGDEEKEKDGKDKDEDEDQADADRRAGKRSRSKKNDDSANDRPVPNRNPSNGGAGKRNGKNRLRDENDQPSLPQTPSDAPSQHHRSRSNSNVPTPFNGQQNSGFPYGGNPSTSSFNVGQNGIPSAPQPGSNGSLDLSSLLALQQLLTHNPLALATLGNFGALNPQLSALSSQLGNLGNNGNNPLLQQLQQQIQQQQAAQQQQIHQSANNRGPQQNGVLPVSAPPSFPGPTAFPGWGFPANAAQLPNGHQAPFGLTNGINGNFNGIPSANHMHPTASHSASSSNSENSPGVGRSSLDDFRNGEKSKMSAEERADLFSKRAAERDNIPPLKLIDTGNPEADAEANRVAIEEDKRRRNTAASARFRMKKKQREAALETHTKELQDQMSELREEVEKLRNENQWLKGLIQVRSGSEEEKQLNGTSGVEGSNGSTGSRNTLTAKDGSSSAPSSVEALQAAQQLQALHNAVSSQKAAQSKALQAHFQTNGTRNPDTQKDRVRDTGIRPRGVGTQTGLAEDVLATGQKRDRED